MHIWVDADACPAVIKDILFRAAERTLTALTLVANRPLKPPKSGYISAVRVPLGQDVADSHIIEQMQAGDLIITADIPLAAEVIEKDGHALNPRGEFYTKDMIGQKLSMRNFMDDLRGSGVVTGGPAGLSKNNRMAFANQLDRFLAQHRDGENN